MSRMTRVRFETSTESFDGALNENGIAKAIAQKLPIASTVMRWGEELYFDAPVKMRNTKPTREVKVGDIGYWPEGPSLCIFFGKTPASNGNEPRPASDITIVGHTDAPVELLRAVAEGTSITVGLATRPAPKARVARRA